MFNRREHYIHGHIDGSKPLSFNPFHHPDPMNLKVTDIDGTQIGSKNRINKYVGQNLNLIVNDIKGTDAGSRRRGITTDRHINPLTPNYVYPGQVELKDNYNPYGNTLKLTKKKFDVQKVSQNKTVSHIGAKNQVKANK
jgi:hypothetical protein